MEFGRTKSGQRRSPRKQCGRQKMIIDFAELNMTSWVLAPVTYDAGICSGACVFPLGQELHPTNHAVMQNIWSRTMSQKYPRSRHIPPPCCVPHQLDPLPMLYFEADNRVVLESRPEMIVRSCACK